MGVVALAVVVALFLSLYLWDRRSRRHGHTLRSGGDISRSERDVQRNIRASEATMHRPPDPQWQQPDDQRYRHPDR